MTNFQLALTALDQNEPMTTSNKEKLLRLVHTMGFEPTDLEELTDDNLKNMGDTICAGIVAMSDTPDVQAAAQLLAKVTITAYLIGFRNGRRRNGVKEGNGTYL